MITSVLVSRDECTFLVCEDEKSKSSGGIQEPTEYKHMARLGFFRRYDECNVPRLRSLCNYAGSPVLGTVCLAGVKIRFYALHLVSMYT
jgi:hypothetical protein